MHSVEWASLGIGAPSVHVFVVFDLQVKADVVVWKVQEEHQQEVLDDDKYEQAVSGADGHWVSDGWDVRHDERYEGICQDETAELQVVHKEGEGSQ